MSFVLHSLIQYFKRNNLQPSFRKLLEAHGNEIVQELQIVRTPLESWTELLLNIFSLYEFERIKNSNNYDYYFHLTLNITTNMGTKLLLEKNEVLNLERGHKMKPDSEYMNIKSIPSGISLVGLIENTRSRQGEKFFTYRGSNNNCQIFIRDILIANGINNKEYNDFIIQNTQSIFEHNILLRKAVNTVTDVGSAANNIIYGNGVANFDTRLTNTDLDSLAKRLHISLRGVFMKNSIPKQLKNGCYIINLNSVGESGSHWTCFIKINKEVYYFDSYGGYPVQNLMDIASKQNIQVYYNIQQLQNIKSILCGYYCLAFLYFMTHNGGTMFEKGIRFDKLFKTNTKLNDQI